MSELGEALAEFEQLIDGDEAKQMERLLCQVMAMAVRVTTSETMTKLYPAMMQVQAKCFRQMYDALLAEGFTKDEAIVICAHNNPMPQMTRN